MGWVKYLNIALAVVAAVIVAAVVWPRGQGAVKQGAVYDGASITVYGEGNTLDTIAAQVSKPEVFSYDAAKRKAMCDANLIVKGTLQISEPGAAKSTVEFSTRVCGDKKLMVTAEGELRAYNTEFSTVDRTRTAGFCPRGYAVYCDGRLVAHDCSFLFVTGSLSEFLRDKATADVQRCYFEGGDRCSFTTYGLDGRDANIADCRIIGAGSYGLSVIGRSENPVVLRRCEIAGPVAAVLNEGDTDLVLVDCLFARDKLVFSQFSGTVRVKHTIRFQVVDAVGKPVEGVRVTAASAKGAPVSEADGAKTGPDGTCSLELTEYVASKRAPVRRDDTNAATPHDLVVYSASGDVIARQDGLDVAGAARARKAVVIQLGK